LLLETEFFRKNSVSSLIGDAPMSNMDEIFARLPEEAKQRILTEATLRKFGVNPAAGIPGRWPAGPRPPGHARRPAQKR
jgi:hypothetical protein